MYKVLDLIAGAGGLSLGFEMTKLFNVCAIVENNENAANTYIENHPGLKNYKDILNVDFRQILKEQGAIDVVIGGPPCQGFSNANRQRRHLINGSNELVKKYVEAIKELQPSIFVMENVKNIASNKHSFCLTHGDEEYIRNQLELTIYNKDVILYEGNHVNDLIELINNFSVHELTLVNEEQLYSLYNIYKKTDKIKEYFSKSINVKKAEEIFSCMVAKEVLYDWYNKITINANKTLTSMLDTKGNGEFDGSYIKQFWDVQRFFNGIIELNNKDAIYEIIPRNHQIVIRMSTYIVIDFILTAFKDLQYVTEGKVLNAADYGVPQSRERYFLIGVKKNLLGKRMIKLPEPIVKDSSQYLSVKKAINDLEVYEPTTRDMCEIQIKKNNPPIDSFFREIIIDNKSNEIFNHVCTETSEIAKERFKFIEQGMNFHSLPEEFKSTYENPGRTQNTIYKRLKYDEPSDTVVNVRKSMWIHPVFDRAISAREAARLQSFPDSYRFLGTKDSVYQQIGNAVPPLLGRSVAEVVIELLDPNQEYIKLRDIYLKYSS